MARIPDDERDWLKRNLSLVELCKDYGIELIGEGDNLKACCPFHDDTEPSFIVSPSKNLWNCLGACQAGGDNIEFIIRKERCSFREAVEILQRKAGRSPESPVIKTRAGTEHPILVEPSENLTDADLLQHVASFYEQTFWNKPQAMEYLKERKCFCPKAVKKFRIGYANRTLCYRVPDTTEAGRALKARLQKVGILRDSGHEHLNGCVIFPVFKADGSVGEMYGRRITKPRNPDDKHVYLPGPHAGVFNWEAIMDADDWHVCEAAIDALSLYVNGIENVTFSFGVNGFSPDHWALLKTRRRHRLFIWYDNDEAGNKGANELAQGLEAIGVEAWRVELPPYADVNEVVKSCKNIDEARGQLASYLAAAVRLLPCEVGSSPPSDVKRNESAAKLGVIGFEPTAPVNQLPVVHPKPENSFEVTTDNQQATFSVADRSYRIRGLDKNTSFEHLKVNVRFSYQPGQKGAEQCARAASHFHMETFDLYNARARAAFIAAACEITGIEKNVIESDLLVLLDHLDRHQEKQILETMQPKAATQAALLLTPEQEAGAFSLLRHTRLIEQIMIDYRLIGTVGEETNGLIGYLVGISRKLAKPLSALIVSRSSAGKSSLMNAILDFIPPEDKQVVTAMTTQALYYMPQDGLKHKVIAITEDEGSQQSAYALKILQSERELILLVPIKENDVGMPSTQLKKVEGPCAQLMTSTKPEIDHETMNRFLVLSVDEDKEQTHKIHALQRQKRQLSGLLAQLEKDKILEMHHNAQRLLRPLAVNIPFVDKLKFPCDRLRYRRDNEKYLVLIETIAFLHQYQRPIHTLEHGGKILQYIDATKEDVRLANQLISFCMGKCLDEMTPPTRSFLMALHAMVTQMEADQKVRRDRIRFTQRQIREATKWCDTQVRRYLEKLLQLEYVAAHKVPGSSSGRVVYELLWNGEGQDGEKFILGLTDPDEL